MSRRVWRSVGKSVLPLFCMLPACSASGGASQAGSGGAYGVGGYFGGGGNSAGGYYSAGGGNAYAGSGGSVSTPGSGGVPVYYDGDAGPYPYNTSITFSWPEATSTGTCEAGHYSGTFSGFYSSTWTVVGVPIPVAGNLSLTLAQSTDGEFFTITGGKLCGLADGLFPFSADIVGTLDCKKGELVNSKLTNGGYWFGIVVGPPAGTFDGPLPATYDKLTHSFTGTWKVYEPDSSNLSTPYGGSGDWNTTLGAASSTSQAGCVSDAGAP